MSNNPLQQFFRRPSVYLRLPSEGKGYPEGSLDLPENGELPIYPMTAIDEITTKTPDALFNGNAIAELIKSCVPNIKDPWKIPSVDIDPILVAIRTATHGTTMEIETTCPNCEEPAKYDVNLPAILSGFKHGEYDIPLVINDEITIKFKPLPFSEMNDINMTQFEFQKRLTNIIAIEDPEQRNIESKAVLTKMNEMYVELISKTIEYIKVPTATVFEKEYIKEFLQHTDKKSYDSISEYSIKLRESSEIKPLQMKCMHCQHEYSQPFSINVSDFFG